jgi:hypothetical protein
LCRRGLSRSLFCRCFRIAQRLPSHENCHAASGQE